MQKRLLLVVIITIVLGVGIYFARRSGTNLSQPNHITLAQAAKTLLYLPLYVAEDQGYFREEGINVNVVTSGGDSQAFAALASGQAQFAQGDPTFVAISHERGGPGIVIASVLDRLAFWGISFDKSLQPFSDPKDFRGLTVVTYPAPNTAYVVQKALLQKAGLQLGKDSTIVQVAFGSELGPLRAGTAQIAVSIEPTVSQAVAQGAHVVFSYPNAAGPFLLTGLMTTEQFASQNPKVVQGIVDAYERALRLIRQNPALASTIGAKYFPEVPAAVIQAAVTRLISQSVFPEHAKINIEAWSAALQLRVQVGDLKNAAHDDLVANQYGDAAMLIKQ